MTVQKKELAVRMQPNGQMYEVHYVGGGELPSELSGSYTSKRVARASISAYVHKRDSGKKTNATSKKADRTK